MGLYIERIVKACKMGLDADKFLSPESGFWAGCPIPRVDLDTSAFVIFDDFTSLSLGDATGKWTLDNTNGSAVLTDCQLFDGTNEKLGGIVKVGTDGSLAEDFACMKVSSTDTGAPFKITSNSGKKLWFATKIYVSSITDCSYYVGLCDQTVTEPGADDTGAENFGVAQDGVYFRTLNASPTAIGWAHTKNGTETIKKAGIGTLTASTWITLGLYFNGLTGVIPYIDGVAQDYAIATGASNFPGGSTDQGLTPFFYVKEGAGTATYIYVDWIKCVQIR